MLLVLELVARAPGWNGVLSFAGRSNMPAGTELSLPKLSVGSVALPKAEVLAAAPRVDVDGDLAGGAADAGGVAVDPKPANGVEVDLDEAGAGELKPLKLEDATIF